MRSLAADGAPRALWLWLPVAAILAAWGVWLVRADVGLYEVSARCRLESTRATHLLAAQTAGRVVATHLALGRAVTEGEVLVELDSEAERLELEEERRRIASAAPQLEALRAEVAAEQRALDGLRSSARLAVGEAEERLKEGEMALQLSKMQRENADELLARGVVAPIERSQAQLEEEQRRSSTAALRYAVGRLQGERQVTEHTLVASIERLRKETAALEAEMHVREATVARLEASLQRRKVRAPVTGHVAEVAEIKVGAVVREGERLGAVVPAGELRAVAMFPPATALGRVRPGQPARIRLDAFPWIRHGSLRAVVSAVASEPSDGLLRVELALEPEPGPAVSMQHGLEGSALVEIGRLSPAALLLEAAGRGGS